MYCSSFLLLVTSAVSPLMECLSFLALAMWLLSASILAVSTATCTGVYPVSRGKRPKRRTASSTCRFTFSARDALDRDSARSTPGDMDAAAPPMRLRRKPPTADSALGGGMEGFSDSGEKVARERTHTPAGGAGERSAYAGWSREGGTGPTEAGARGELRTELAGRPRRRGRRRGRQRGSMGEAVWRRWGMGRASSEAREPTD
jgi:hypothetical protein